MKYNPECESPCFPKLLTLRATESRNNIFTVGHENVKGETVPLATSLISFLLAQTQGGVSLIFRFLTNGTTRSPGREIQFKYYVFKLKNKSHKTSFTLYLQVCDVSIFSDKGCGYIRQVVVG